MFFFNRSKSGVYNDFSEIAVDMHSHLIPGVDDGAPAVADSLYLINGLKELGFTHLITTPHTFQEIHPNTRETLQSGHDLIKNQVPENMHLSLSSEYYLDAGFNEQLESNTLMPLPGNRLLIEFSQLAKPPGLDETIFDLNIRGYQVVLAHPERYRFFQEHPSAYNLLKNMNVEFQVNALSLIGRYGDRAKKVAENLIKKEFIDFIGTDLHNTDHLEQLKQVPKTKSFQRLVESGLLKNRSLIEG